MNLFRSLIVVAGVGLALAGTADRAFAWPPCFGCSHGGGHGVGAPTRTSLLGGLGAGHQKLPVFQAAPWYNYWPYDGHFLTPAPIGGAFYGPPGPGNFPVNPYFPGGPQMGGFPQQMPPR
ncbi:MAG: hypothetical protein K2V38_18090 [Gemmataceae bacterium]|nr:hypothetical protein [Gemmataceae bacterium]